MPPGTLVRLSSGETAVVTRVHAPDPYRPRVRILFGSDGARRNDIVERNLWEPSAESGAVDSVTTPLDPTPFGIDPLTFVPVSNASRQ